MDRKGLVLVLALVAGLLGGTVSGRFLVGDLVRAQDLPQKGKVIEAERFQVVDKSGTPRAYLGTTGEGIAALVIGHEQGKSRAALSTLPDGSVFLALLGPDGRSTSLTWDAGGRMGLVLLDKNKNIRGEVVLTPDGSPFLIFQDKSGKVLYKSP